MIICGEGMASRYYIWSFLLAATFLLGLVNLCISDTLEIINRSVNV